MKASAYKTSLHQEHQQQVERIDLLKQTLERSLWGLYPHEVPKQIATNVIYIFAHMLEPHHPLAQTFYLTTLRDYQFIDDIHVRRICDELNLKENINGGY